MERVEQLPPGTPTLATTSNIHAELIFILASRSPEVILSFEGLNVPVEMFRALSELGWGIPPVPPPPGSAIDWIPDPVAGTDYTLKPWTVTEYKLRQAESWTSEDEKTIGARTIHVLKSHGVVISGLRGQVEQEQSTAQQQNTAQPEAVAAPTHVVAAPAGTASAPAATLVLVPGDTDVPDYMTSWTAKGGRSRTPWAWYESSTPLSTSEAQTLEAQGASVWLVDADMRTDAAPGTTALNLIFLDATKANKSLQKLEKLFDSAPTTSTLTSLTGGAHAILVSATVPGNSAEMMISNLLLRFPKMVLRD